MRKSLLLILGLILIGTVSCEYKYIDPIEVIIPDGEVSFSSDVEPMFQDKCVTCHSSTKPVLTTGNAFSSLTNGGYINTADPEASDLYEKVLSGHPGGNNGLSAEEKGYILKWIMDGAENN